MSRTPKTITKQQIDLANLGLLMRWLLERFYKGKNLEQVLQIIDVVLGLLTTIQSKPKQVSPADIEAARAALARLSNSLDALEAATRKK